MGKHESPKKHKWQTIEKNNFELFFEILISRSKTGRLPKKNVAGYVKCPKYLPEKCFGDIGTKIDEKESTIWNPSL